MKGMAQYFFFSPNVTNLLFKGWTIPTGAVTSPREKAIAWILPFVLTCLLFFVGSVVLEALSTLGVYLTRCYATNPLKMKWTSSINTRSPLLAPLQIPSSVSKVRKRRCKIHFGRSLVHILSVTLGYMLMLAVMTYNAYFLVAVALGSALGYFLFAPFRRPPPKKAPEVNQRAQRDDMTRSGHMDPSGDDTPNVQFYGTM
ncbi:uncharacterized protein [Diadema antillarum]|uniref:uncharacterized protein n=1 Tax=Diadema antillarum TaxID=105358 RepID=UPI003A84A2D5